MQGYGSKIKWHVGKFNEQPISALMQKWFLNSTQTQTSLISRLFAKKPQPAPASSISGAAKFVNSVPSRLHKNCIDVLGNTLGLKGLQGL